MAELLVLLWWAGGRRAARGATRPPGLEVEVLVGMVGMVMGPSRDMLVRGRIDKSEIFQTGVNTWKIKRE